MRITARKKIRCRHRSELPSATAPHPSEVARALSILSKAVVALVIEMLVESALEVMAGKEVKR